MQTPENSYLPRALVQRHLMCYLYLSHLHKFLLLPRAVSADRVSLIKSYNFDPPAERGFGSATSASNEGIRVVGSSEKRRCRHRWGGDFLLPQSIGFFITEKRSHPNRPNSSCRANGVFDTSLYLTNLEIGVRLPFSLPSFAFQTLSKASFISTVKSRRLLRGVGSSELIGRFFRGVENGKLTGLWLVCREASWSDRRREKGPGSSSANGVIRSALGTSFIAYFASSIPLRT